MESFFFARNHLNLHVTNEWSDSIFVHKHIFDELQNSVRRKRAYFRLHFRASDFEIRHVLTIQKKVKMV